MKKVKTIRAVEQTGRYYRDICWMMIPLLCMAVYYYGLRPLAMCAVAMLTGNLCDRLVSVLRQRPYVQDDFSNECFALVIAMLLPASAAWYVLVCAVLAGILIGKEAFGGYGSYPFHPAAVGYVVAAVSWPEQVFRYPAPHTMLPLIGTEGVTLTAGISETLKNGGLPTVNSFDLVLGDYAGPMGATAALVVLSCALFLLVRRDIHLETPLCFVLVCALVAFFAPRQADLVGTGVLETAAQRLAVVRYELLSGAVLYGVVFLLGEPYTSPRNRLGRALYGALVGAVAMAFRYYGVYETGMCFGLLAVNSVSGWLDRLVARMRGARRAKKLLQGGGAA